MIVFEKYLKAQEKKLGDSPASSAYDPKQTSLSEVLRQGLVVPGQSIQTEEQSENEHRKGVRIMLYVMGVISISSLLFGFLILIGAKSAIHEVQAGIFFLICINCLGFASVVHALNRLGRH